ncbi:MAG: hypothetical protein AAGK78_09270, partial [Planctomycetota bacterium]
LAAMTLLVGVSQWAEPRYIGGASVNNRGYGSDAKSIFDVVRDFTTGMSVGDAAQMRDTLDGKNAVAPTPYRGTGDPLDDAIESTQQMHDAAMTVVDTAQSGVGVGSILQFADSSDTKREPDRPSISQTAVKAAAEPVQAQSLPGPAMKIEPPRIWWSLDASGLRVAGLDVTREVPLADLTSHWGKPDVVQRAGTNGDCWLTWTELDLVAYARRTETGGVVNRIGYYPEAGKRHMLKVAGERFEPRADTDAFVGGVRLRRFVTHGKPLVVFDLAKGE